jgi:3-oxoacyl-[acyl-carrier protein] reductase
MDLGLQGRKALVLASSSGLGFATAQALAREGAQVVVNGRRREQLNEAADRISAVSRQEVHTVLGDLTTEDGPRTIVEEAVDSLGGLDILVCNSGGPRPGRFDILDDSAWAEAVNLTLLSFVRAVRHAIPHLRGSDAAAILAFASSSVRQPIENLTLSNTLRPAVAALCKSLADELAPTVRVNCLSPGRILTDRTRTLDEAKARREGKPVDQVRAESEAAIPLGRLGNPDEFGRVAAFLVSPAASYVTGASVLVDGGMVRGW